MEFIAYYFYGVQLIGCTVHIYRWKGITQAISFDFLIFSLKKYHFKYLLFINDSF